MKAWSLKERRTKQLMMSCSICLVALAGSHAIAQIEIVVPNYSFEAPFTVFAYPNAEEWDETGPVSENPQLPGVIDTLDTGVFFNSPVDGNGEPSPFYISNADGSQLGFIGAKDDDDIAFLQQLDVPFEGGAVYTLTVDVGESSWFPPLTYNPNESPPPDPDPAELAVGLYYVDVEELRHSVGGVFISTDDMPTGPDAGLLLATFAATTELSEPGDAWIGEPIGIEILPFVGLSGIWNVDNVQLVVDCGSGGLTSDSNVDGVIDATDYAVFALCATGPEGGSRPAGCPPCAFERLDDDDDGDLDLHDFSMLAEMFDQ